MKSDQEQVNRYFPIEGGWRIRINPTSPFSKEYSDIGVCTDDPRLHRRPLYPPADRGILLEKVPAEKVERLPNNGSDCE